jgi:hypothetical protein
MSTPDEAAPPARTELDIAFTPRQIFGGFALLAALIIILARMRRPKRSSDD